VESVLSSGKHLAPPNTREQIRQISVECSVSRGATLRSTMSGIGRRPHFQTGRNADQYAHVRGGEVTDRVTSPTQTPQYPR
jgi:hypothetical protein